MRLFRVRVWGLLVLAGLLGRPASAQAVFETVGERALGMGGAFVGVADDATATYWNPAGLGSKAAAGITIGWYQFQSGNQGEVPTAGPLDRTSSLTALGSTPAGLSYGRYSTTTLTTGAGGVLTVQSLQVSQYGLTLVQSIASGITAGATLKYERGELLGEPAAATSVANALAQLNGASGSTSGAFDLDLGLMITTTYFHLGGTLKNVRQPVFGSVATPAGQLPREGRVGVAILPTRGLTLAMDLDLNTVGLQGDLRRMFAIGGEAKLGTHLQVRSGVRWNLAGTISDPIVAFGVSVSPHQNIWVDSHYAVGQTDEDREFGVALRLGT